MEKFKFNIVDNKILAFGDMPKVEIETIKLGKEKPITIAGKRFFHSWVLTVENSTMLIENQVFNNPIDVLVECSDKTIKLSNLRTVIFYEESSELCLIYDYFSY